jgi:F-type H+-transporting ATPase subunit delta
LASHDDTVSGMAGRYATALFELALESEAVDEVSRNLGRFEALLAESSDLARLVRSPVFSADEQGRALAAVLDRSGIGGLAAQFLAAVAANRRLFAVRDMIRGFHALSARHRGEINAEVTAAEPINERHVEAVRGRCARSPARTFALPCASIPA